MNEKIIELAKEAGIHPANFEPDADLSGPLKKFAELIVRECAKIAEKEQAYNDSHEIHVNIDQCILIEFGL